MTVSALMYHALYSSNSELRGISEEDKPYAISLATFKQQLDLLIENNIHVLNPDVFNDFTLMSTNEHYALLTFDDGHASFYHYAYPELVKRGMAGIFFVTSDLIKNREDFCNWKQLKEMSSNGMCIQSHGKTHNFISGMNSHEAREELLDSKTTIEDELELKVRLISFPGGRYSKRDIKIGIELGYEFFFTSNEGVNKNLDKNTIKRLALRSTTEFNEFLKLSKGDFFLINKRIVIYRIKNLIKKIIGNNLYHFIYKRYRLN